MDYNLRSLSEVRVTGLITMLIRLGILGKRPASKFAFDLHLTTLSMIDKLEKIHYQQKETGI